MGMVKLVSQLSLSVALTFAAVGAASAQECRGGILFDAVTGRPLIDPVSKQPMRCGGGDLFQDNTGLAVGAAALVVAGTLGGLGASGAFNSHNNPPSVILLPISQNSPPTGPLSGQ